MFKKRVVPEGANIFNEIQKIRCSAGVSLKALSKKTKIPLKHLKNLEEGSKDLLPDVLYAKNIIKKYLEFFNIDPAPYLQKIELVRKENVNPKSALKIRRLIVLPRIIKGVILTITILTFLLYLVFSINKIFEAPNINILYPADGETVHSSILEVKGKTEKGVTITLNDQEVILDKDNDFNMEINLQKGLNLIKITGIKRYSKENTIWRNVILEINE